jgi:hypothetical protein
MEPSSPLGIHNPLLVPIPLGYSGVLPTVLQNLSILDTSREPDPNSLPWSNFADLVGGCTAPTPRYRETKTVHVLQERSLKPEPNHQEAEHLETLAQNVYEQIRQRLRVEQERYRGSYPHRLPW